MTVPKWLQGMFAPTLMLWFYALSFGIVSAMSSGGTLPGIADYVAEVALALILAAWVTADAQKRHRPLCYDFDSLVFFTWPVTVPVYLFRTRGVRALLTVLCFAGIWLVAMLAALVVIIMREFVLS